jgi:hypothetical protein
MSAQEFCWAWTAIMAAELKKTQAAANANGSAFFMVVG